jgi:hypothetical protein
MTQLILFFLHFSPGTNDLGTCDPKFAGLNPATVATGENRRKNKISKVILPTDQK